jgi:hypothetical protein
MNTQEKLHVEKAKQLLADVEARNNGDDNFWGKPLYTYTSDQAVEDGFLVENPRQEVFGECNLLTTNLYERLRTELYKRNLERVFPMELEELIGCFMHAGKKQYDPGTEWLEDDHDKNFFTIAPSWDGVVVWFVRNEHGKLTAMLPEDY